MSDNQSAHFKGKDAIGHVAEAQAHGIISAAEVHGIETPGYLSAGCDAGRETAIFLPFLWLLMTFLHIPAADIVSSLAIFSLGWLFWKLGRSAWLGWFRLERLNRVLEEERWEIEHHRQQERDELGVLYATKGFEGKLLEDVLDVLMADNSRLLKVMVEEELGLSLASSEHPLKQGMGAAMGVFLSALVCLAAFFVWPAYGIFFGSFISISISSYLMARFAGNEVIPAIIWNLGLAILSFGCVYFLLDWMSVLARNV